MSDYEDLCESFGLNPGSEKDYDRLLDMLTTGKGRPRPSADDDEPEGGSSRLEFSSFREALEWSKANGGRPFTRTPDGNAFVPVGETGSGGYRAPKPKRASRAGSWEDGPEVRAFLAGDPAPGSDWLPGTYPHSSSEGPDAHADYEKERRWLMPRLEVLAPGIAQMWRRHRYSMFDLRYLMRSKLHQKQTAEQLQELLALLEGKLVRSRRWYGTQAMKRPLAVKRRPPDELQFWERAVAVVREEYEARANRPHE